MALTRKRNRPEDWEELEASPVIHIRELPEHTLEIDLSRAFEIFGRIRDITMLPNKCQALVEFQDISSAESVVLRSAEETIAVAGHRVKVNFSTSKRIIQRASTTATGNPNDGPTVSSENNVLLLTIYNAQYPITVDVINQITSRHGRISRIVIFRKSGVQAMVEFRSVEEAKTAKRHLNGADIYSGCCTLKVEFARPTRLSVTKNDQDTWDFENPMPTPGIGGVNVIDGRNQGPTSLLGRFEGGFPRFENGRNPVSNMYSMPSGAVALTAPGAQMMGSIAMPGNQPTTPGGLPGHIEHMGGGMHSGTPVVMVYNLDMTRVNCDRLFNLLCLYGNVWRIKFLRTKEGSAMVQMGDGASVERVIPNLTGVSLFDNRLQVRQSKQQVILDVPQPYDLPDGTPSFKDYTGSRENRYVNPEMASKNRIYPPSRTLHFWNCPPNFAVSDIRQIFVNNGAQPPEQFLAFNKGGEKSSSGLVEWNSRSDAVAGLVLCNHAVIPFPEGRYPFVMKLSFSNSPIKERSAGMGGNAIAMGNIPRIPAPATSPVVPGQPVMTGANGSGGMR